MNNVDRINLSKVTAARLPIITVAPILSLDDGEWELLYTVIKRVVERVYEEINSPILVDIQDVVSRSRSSTECSRSEDGYHEIVKYRPKTVESCYLCIHCGSLFKRCALPAEELEKHFNERGHGYLSQGVVHETTQPSSSPSGGIPF